MTDIDNTADDTRTPLTMAQLIRGTSLEQSRNAAAVVSRLVEVGALRPGQPFPGTGRGRAYHVEDRQVLLSIDRHRSHPYALALTVLGRLSTSWWVAGCPAAWGVGSVDGEPTVFRTAASVLPRLAAGRTVMAVPLVPRVEAERGV